MALLSDLWKKIKPAAAAAARDTGNFAKTIFTLPAEKIGNTAVDIANVARTAGNAVKNNQGYQQSYKQTAQIPQINVGSRNLQNLANTKVIPQTVVNPINIGTGVATSFLTPGLGKVKALEAASPLLKLGGYTALRAGEGAAQQGFSTLASTGNTGQAFDAAKTGAIYGGVGNVLGSPRLVKSAFRQIDSKAGPTIGNLVANKNLNEAKSVLYKKVDEGIGNTVHIVPEKGLDKAIRQGDIKKVIGVNHYQDPGPKVKVITDDTTGTVISMTPQRPEFAEYLDSSVKPLSSAQAPTGNVSKYENLRATPGDPNAKLSMVGAQARTSTPDINNAFSSAPATGSKQRGFVTSVQESDKFGSEIKDTLTGTYNPKSNAKLVSQAQANIDKSGAINRYQEILNESPKTVNDSTIVESIILAKQLAGSGNHAAASEILRSTAEKLTEAGRAVQAASLLNKVEPEGVLYMANKAARDAGIELTPQQSKEIFERATAIKNMTAGTEQNIARHGLLQDIQNIVPTSTLDKVLTVWKAGLLTGPKTTIRNVASNAINAGAESIKNIPASMADAVMGLKTGERTLTATTKGYGSGFVKGLGKSKEIAKYGFDPEEVVGKLDFKKVNFGEGKVAKAFQWYTDKVFNTLQAQDKPFYHGALKQSLFDQAGAEAINVGKRGDKKFITNLVLNPSETMMKNAIHDAEVSTFQNSSPARTAISKLKKEISKSPVGKVLTETNAPFTGTPTSAAGQMLGYATGIPTGAVKAAKVLMGKGDAALQRQASQEIGRGTVGAGVIALGGTLVAKGMITGDMPRDENEQRQWELEGKQPNSIKIGAEWRQISSLGPQAALILTGAKVFTAKNPGEALSSVGKTIVSSSALSGVNSAVNALQDPQRYGQALANQYASGLIPTAVKDVAKSLDTNDQGRQITRETNNTLDSLTNSLPGLRNNNLPKRNALGEVVTGPSSSLDPFNSKAPTTGSLVDELSRLTSVGLSVTPGKVDNTVKAFGQKVQLDPKQLDVLEQSTGGQVSQQLNSIISNPGYASLPDEQKAKVLGDAISAIRTNASKQVVSGTTPGTVSSMETTSSTKTSGKPSKQELQIAQFKFANGETDRIQVGDYVISADPTSDTGYRTTDLKQVEKDVNLAKYTIALQVAQRNEDYKTWEKLQANQFQALTKQNQALDPQLDAAKIITNQNTMQDIAVNVAKYRSYGGAFKKPKKGRTIRMPKVPTVSTSQVRQARVTQPKIKSQKIKLAKVKQPKTR